MINDTNTASAAEPGSPHQGCFDFGGTPERESNARLRAVDGVVSLLRNTDSATAKLEDSLSSVAHHTRSSHVELLSVDLGDSTGLASVASLRRSPFGGRLRTDVSLSEEMKVLTLEAVASGQPISAEGGARDRAEYASALPANGLSRLVVPIIERPTGVPLGALLLLGDRHHLSDCREWLLSYAELLSIVLPRLTAPVPKEETGCSGAPKGRPLPEIVGESEATRSLKRRLREYSVLGDRPDPPVILITGESGTGKDLVARYLHDASNRRARGPFVAHNCAGLRGDLVESRLFGHAKGCFTGAVADADGLFKAAHGGTLFLDEFEDIPPEGQALLLRAIETRNIQPLGDPRETHVNVQLILATNRPLGAEVEAGRIREDLYYRISALLIELLPLRHPTRIADIRPLLAAALAKSERDLGRRSLGMTPAAYRALVRYRWPGNVRQLNNVSLSLTAHAEPDRPIDVADIRRHRPEVLADPGSSHPEAYTEDGSYEEAILAFRDQLILGRLSRFRNNVHEAAASLEVSEPTFYRYWKEARTRADRQCAHEGGTHLLPGLALPPTETATSVLPD